MLIGKKKKIANYLKEQDNFSNFDFILKDYLSGVLTTELKS